VGSKAVNLDMQDSEVKTFEVSSFRYSNVVFAIGGLAAVTGMILRFAFHSFWVGLFTAPFGLLLLYYITFGRLRYLTLEEKKR
jgi:hypothetical protein